MALTAAELNAVYSVDEGPLDKSLAGLSGKVKAGAAALAGAGLIIGGAVAGGVMAGMEAEALTDKVAAQLDLTGPQAERAGRAAGSLYANAYGENLGQVNEAVGAVMSSIGGMRDASEADLESMTAKVLDLAAGFELDVARSAQVAGQMITTGLAKDGTHALDLLTASLQKVPAAVREDLVDAIDEYGPFMQTLGLEGEAAMGLLVKASEKGMYGIDKTGDALKEFTIRATDMSAASKVGFDALGMSQEQMAEKILAGGDTAEAAFNQIVSGLQGIKDPAKQGEAALALFGTPLEDLNTSEIPAFLASLSSTETALTGVEGAAERFGDKLNDNASEAFTSLKRGAETAVVGLANELLPAVKDAAAWLAQNLGPAVSTVGNFLTDTLVPGLKSAAQWMSDHGTTVKVVAGIIGTLLLPTLVRLVVGYATSAAAAVASAATQVGAWLALQVRALATGAVLAIYYALNVVGWVSMAAAAVANAAIIVAQWALMGARAVASAAMTAAAWLAAQVRTVASLAVMAAGFIAQGAVMVASMAVTAAGVVAGWALMGAQALIRAAQMAAAWVIAMGPVGWVIAAVIGLVALIIANWDTVVSWTKTAWSAVTGALSAAWDWITGVARAGAQRVMDVVGWFGQLPGRVAGWFGAVRDAIVNALQRAWSAISALPGQISGVFANAGSWLVSAGRNLLEGLWRGISGAGSWLYDKVMGWANSLLDGVKSFFGIASPSKEMAQVGRFLMQGMGAGIDSEAKTAVSAAERAAAAISDAMQVSAPGLQSMADMQAMSGLTSRRPMFASGGTTASAASAGGAGGIGTLLHIDSYQEAPGSSPQQNAQALAIEARTRGWV